MAEKVEKTKNIKVPKKRRKWVYVLLFLLALPFFCFVLLQTSPVQNKVVDYFSSKFSNDIDGDISIDKVDVSIQDGLILEGFKLIENSGDTILSSKSLNVSLTESLYSLIDNSLSLDKVQLDEPTIRIVTKEGEKENNLAKILKSLSSSEGTKEEGKPFKLDINQVDITNLDIELTDHNKKKSQFVSVEKGSVVLNTFLKDNILDIERITLDRPIIRIKKYEGELKILIEDDEIKEIVEEVSSDSTDLEIKLGQLKINRGLFSLNDFNKKPHGYKDVLDLAHFEIRDIDLSVSDLIIKDDLDIKMNLDKLDFIDDKGFEVNKFSSQGIEINSKTINFPQLSFVTDRTNLTRSMRFDFNNFEDFSDFERKVNMTADFNNSRVYFGDVMHFVKKLNTSAFFIQNKSKTVGLSGKVSGPVDNLQGNKMSVTVGNDLVLDASFSTRKITVKDGEFLDIRMKNLDTNMDFLKSFIPGFNPPENFNKLGRINFNGSFYGYLKDFVVFGGLNSAMGDAFLDMRLDVKDGTDLAKYSGELSVEQFELGAWTDNSDLELVDFSASISDGKGLTLESVYSDLYATVESLTFKGYEYKDFVMDAQVDKSKFNGEFSISDENIDFVFDGTIEIEDSIPHLDFKANIENIDFEKLNLTSDAFKIQGNVDINGFGRGINDVEGKMIASDLMIFTRDTLYAMDTISLAATNLAPDNREIKLFSDIARVELEGVYDLTTIIPSTKSILKNNYPHFTQNWKEDQFVDVDRQDLRFDLSIYDSQNFFDLVGVEDLSVKGFKAKGTMDSEKGDLSFASSVPYLGIKDNSFWDAQILISSDNNRGDILINVDSTVIGQNSFNPIDLQSKMIGDTVEFLVSTTEIVDSLQSLDIQGRLVPHPKGYQVNLTDNKIVALGGEWSFDQNNSIVFGSKYHKIDNLRMTDGARSITIDDVGTKGIALYLADFNFSTLNGLINYDKMDFAGKGDVSLFVDDVYENKNIGANVYIEDFTINEDSYGTLEIDLNKDDGEPVAMLFSLGDQDKELMVNASLDTENNNHLDAKVRSKDFPLKIFEYILADGIKNVNGGVNLKAEVNGPIDDMKIDGVGQLNGGVTIIYTGVEYLFKNQEVRVSEKVIDLTGAKIIDPEDGEGTITGGLFHDMFRNFRLDALISGTDVVALNTTKFENPLYYGYGKGDMSVKFTGPFHLVNMKINASAKEGSVLNIPISEGETTTDKNFIKFVKREDLFAIAQDDEDPFRFEGLDIEINLSMTPDARVNIIFDESRGDIIQGNGRGNMKMNITRYGDFDMYGTYDIERGEYLFTALGAVAKPFQVRRGGQIRWTGDPINAELDIVADYQVRTSLDVFLSEFISQEDTELFNAAKSKTQVKLILNLGGTLYNPNVNFGLDFPDLQGGRLGAIVQNKMRTMNANQAELNSQVLGLIVFNSFLPSNSSSIAIGGSDIGTAGIGTLSEFVSSQLSILFTGLLNEVFADNNIISGLDFDIGFRKNSFNGVQSNNTDIAPDEYEARVKGRFKFLDERLSLDLGGNYVRENLLNGSPIGDYFIGDFVLEYYLTDDRKLKLRMYGRYDYDEFVIARRQKYGLGVGYRTEFGTLSDFKKTVTEQFKDIKSDSSAVQEE